MDRLDSLVVEHLQNRLFQPGSFGSVMALRSARASEVNIRITRLQSEISDVDDRLKRLSQMIEEGVTDLDDIMKARISAFVHDRDREKTAHDRLRETRSCAMTFDPETIERTEVDDHIIRIIGNTATLEQAIGGGAVSPEGVCRSIQKWRATQNKTANTYVIEIAM